MKTEEKKELEKMIEEKFKEHRKKELQKLIEERLIKEAKREDEAIMKRDEKIRAYGNKIISGWKRQCIISDNWNEVVFNYYNATYCEECNQKFIEKDEKSYEMFKGRYRVLDHDHDNGNIRNIICHTCNVRRGASDKKKRKKLKKREVDMGGYMGNEK